MYVSFALMYGIRLHVPSRHVSSCTMKIKYFHLFFSEVNSNFQAGQNMLKPIKLFFCQFFQKQKYRNILMLIIFFYFSLFQKARLARIQIAKATSGAAFVSKKKAAEAKMAAKAAGMPIDDNYKEDVFELQHHHLLRCLEKTTVSRFSVSYLLVSSIHDASTLAQNPCS